MRTKTQVDRAKLEESIRQAEANGPLSGQSLVWQKAAELYNQMDPPAEITFPVVMLRAKEWDIQIKTPIGKRGRPAGVPLTDEQKAAMKAGRQRRHDEAEAEPEPEPTAPVTAPDEPAKVRGADSRFLRVLTPAGACPVKLADHNPETVEAWREAVRQVGIERQVIYTDDALEYWLRTA